eukprot:594327-Pleurochrysis_carterae.AAC.6
MHLAHSTAIGEKGKSKRAHPRTDDCVARRALGAQRLPLGTGAGGVASEQSRRWRRRYRRCVASEQSSTAEAPSFRQPHDADAPNLRGLANTGCRHA